MMEQENPSTISATTISPDEDSRANPETERETLLEAALGVVKTFHGVLSFDMGANHAAISDVRVDDADYRLAMAYVSFHDYISSLTTRLLRTVVDHREGGTPTAEIANVAGITRDFELQEIRRVYDELVAACHRKAPQHELAVIVWEYLQGFNATFDLLRAAFSSFENIDSCKQFRAQGKDQYGLHAEFPPKAGRKFYGPDDDE